MAAKRITAQFKVNDLVKLRPDVADNCHHRTAYNTTRIERFYDAGTSGRVKLQKALAGFYSWNIADLIRAHKVSKH